VSEIDKTKETWAAPPERFTSVSLREACLVHIYPSGPTMGRRYPLTEPEILVGRGDTCTICIPDNSISRMHAQLQATPEGFRVTDLGSKNGTFVNDRQLDAPAKLCDGDNLRIGNFLYRYLAGGSVEADYHEEIYRLTIRDGLTRAHNRRALTEFLDRELVRAERHQRPLSVLMIDIDHFKSINDNFGHLCGDLVLRKLADSLSEGIRAEDMFARFGGEEFCMVLVETSAEDAIEIGERVRSGVAAMEIPFEGTVVRITVSVGVATTSGETPIAGKDLIQRADEKLYEAKRSGRNRVHSEAAVAVEAT
jgi:diguanylate cyclase (GGDEF)-like protein